MKFLCLISVLFCLVQFSFQLTSNFHVQPGIFSAQINDCKPQYITKSLYRQASISVLVKSLNEATCKTSLMLDILIVGMPCKDMYSSINMQENELWNFISAPQTCASGIPEVFWRSLTEISCHKNSIFTILPYNNWTISNPSLNYWRDNNLIENRDKIFNVLSQNPESTTNTVKIESQFSPNVVTRTPFTGEYIVIFRVFDKNCPDCLFFANFGSFQVDVTMTNFYGYLSADDFPVMIFYLILAILCGLMCLFWTATSVKNYDHINRLHGCIGIAVAIEFISIELSSTQYYLFNKYGNYVSNMETFFHVLVSLKITVTRFLVILVSLGYGTIKSKMKFLPYSLTGLAIMYFTFLMCFFSFNEFSPVKQYLLIAFLAFELIIFLTVMNCLRKTMKTLNLQQNVTKLAHCKYLAITILLSSLIVIRHFILSVMYYYKKDCHNNFVMDSFELKTTTETVTFILLFITVTFWRPTVDQTCTYSQLSVKKDGDLPKSWQTTKRSIPIPI